MNIGIIGLPLSGKTLLFTSLVGNSFRKEEHPLEKLTLCSGNLKLEDKRLLHLAQVFGSRKITFPEIKIQDIIFYEREKEKWSVPPLLREVAGFVGVLRCFEYPGLIFPDPLRERRYIEEELILKDLEIVQKRIARIEQEMKKGKKDEEKEFLVLQKINHFLEENRSLREVSLNPGEEKMLHGFKFLSQKPIFFVLNLDERMGLKEVEEIKKQVITEKNNFIFASLKLESELSEMKTEEQRDFLESFGFQESLQERFLSACFNYLGLVVFFTVKGEEARAWLINRNTPALKAAGEIHSDMEKGFIKAEVINYQDFLKAGSSLGEAKKMGLLRMEAKEYLVQDGDIIDFRFAL